MWPEYDEQEARMEAMRAAVLEAAAAQLLLKKQARQRRSRQRKWLRVALYRVGGWLRHCGDALQRHYREDSQREELVLLVDNAEANGG
jgi:hypothetical protein